MAQFSGDTDAGTDEWGSLTSIERPEVFVTKVTTGESFGDLPDLRNLENRINRVLARSDLRAPELLRVLEHVSNKPMSFQEFRKTYQPATLFFRDIFSRDGEAEVVREVSVEAFQRTGGIYAGIPLDEPREDHE